MEKRTKKGKKKELGNEERKIVKKEREKKEGRNIEEGQKWYTWEKEERKEKKNVCTIMEI